LLRIVGLPGPNIVYVLKNAGPDPRFYVGPASDTRAQLDNHKAAVALTSLPFDRNPACADRKAIVTTCRAAQ
jgi:hypothetical protein